MELKLDPRFRVVGEYWSQIDSILRVNLSNSLLISSQFDSYIFQLLGIIRNWLSILSQFDSNILQLLGNTGRILVPPVTKLFRSKWLHFCLSVNYNCNLISTSSLKMYRGTLFSQFQQGMAWLMIYGYNIMIWLMYNEEIEFITINWVYETVCDFYVHYLEVEFFNNLIAKS